MNYLQKKFLYTILFLIIVNIPWNVWGQSEYQVLRAKVVEIVSEKKVQNDMSGDYVVQEQQATMLIG